MAGNKAFNYPLGTWRLVAVILIVLAHFWVKNSFWMTISVSFCFFYSGFMIASRHPFSPYSVREHARFMYSRLAKLYPLHVLTVVTCMLLLMSMGRLHSVGLRVLLSHLTLVQSFIPDSLFYFGYNPVSWFVCDIMFLYLLSPWVIGLLRRMALWSQLALVGVLLALQFVGGFTGMLGTYHLYEFPPMRVLDFLAGVVLYHCTQSGVWQRLSRRIEGSARASRVEFVGLALLALFYWIGQQYIDPHCLRGFCTSVLAVTAVFVTFLLTQGRGGCVSQLLSVRPVVWLSSLSMEIFLLQHTCYWSFSLLFDRVLPAPLAYGQWPQWLAFVVQMTMLVLVAWLVKRWFVEPLFGLLMRHRH